MKYKFVFLDLDDTLWDFHANAKSSLHEIFNQRNLDKCFECFEQYFDIYAKKNTELWDLYGRGEITKEALSLERFLFPLKQVGINDEQMALNMGKEYLDMLPSRTQLVPQAKELLDYLYPKYPLTVVSNGFVEVQYKKLHSSKLEQYFAHVVLSESAGALKPDKRIFEYALELNNAKASETIMIGDSYEADIAGAQNAGIDQIYFKSNMTEREKILPATFKTAKLEDVFSIL